jgi:hypothetical protein
VKLRIALLLLTAPWGLVGCAGVAGEDAACSTYSLGDLFADPLGYSGKTFCGEAYIYRVDRSVQILRGLEDVPSYDLALLVSSKTDRLLGELEKGRSALFYIRATIDPDPQMECFQPPDPTNGETCVPWARPIMVNLTHARRRR